MLGIVIVANGQLAKEYKKALEQIVGPCLRVESISILPNDNREEKKIEIFNAISTVDEGQGVVIATDMFGSTPSNLAIDVCVEDKNRVIFGFNLPFLVKLIKVRNYQIDEAVKISLKAAKKYIDVV